MILQSCSARQPLDKTTAHLRALMVGHLREEKSPRTYLEAASLLASRADILLDHVGAALDPLLGAEATDLMRTCPRYRWLGGLPHAEARRRIQAAHVLVHPSRMEGGAHVVIEAVLSGTAVLASRIDGNVGLLGEDYVGYFPVGDAASLAALLQRVRDEPALLSRLQDQCAARAALFDPVREASCLNGLVRELLDGTAVEADGVQQGPGPSKGQQRALKPGDRRHEFVAACRLSGCAAGVRLPARPAAGAGRLPGRHAARGTSTSSRKASCAWSSTAARARRWHCTTRAPASSLPKPRSTARATTATRSRRSPA